MERVAVAVSGGVDSLCALLLLKNAGDEVIAVHGLFKPDAEPPDGLAEACGQIGADLEIIDLRDQFASRVVAYHKQRRAACLTPNPCAICNRDIKFGALFEAAMDLGADIFATGHYANLANFENGAACLAPAADESKNQAYFLSLVKSERLAKTSFPLFGQSKTTTRKMVADAGLTPPLKKESQDICFIDKTAPRRPDGKGGLILLRAPDQKSVPLAELPQIGKHKGLNIFTIGQRQGFAIPFSESLYAREMDPASRTLVVSTRDMLEMRACQVGNLNFFLPFDDWPGKIFCRLRYRQPLTPCKAACEGAELRLDLLEDIFASAPGQIAAIYDEFGRILAGGIIERIFFAE